MWNLLFLYPLPTLFLFVIVVFLNCCIQWGAAEQETAGRETTGQETVGQEMVEQRNRYKENPPQIFS